MAQALEFVALAGFEDDVLDIVARRVGGEFVEGGVQLGQRGALDLGRRSPL